MILIIHWIGLRKDWSVTRLRKQHEDEERDSHRPQPNPRAASVANRNGVTKAATTNLIRLRNIYESDYKDSLAYNIFGLLSMMAKVLREYRP